jgi:hypothetical protein
MTIERFYDVGDQMRVIATITRKSTNVPMDPTSLLVRVQPPNAGIYIIEYDGVDDRLERLGVGIYATHLYFQGMEAIGEWVVQYEPSGAAQAMRSLIVTVRKPRIPVV